MTAFILGIWIPLSTAAIPASLRTASNRAGNLPSRSRIRNRALLPASSRSHDEVPGGLDDPRPRRLSGYAQDPDPAAGVLNRRQHEQAGAGQGDGLEEVTGDQGISLGAEKTGPGGAGALRGGGEGRFAA